MALLTDRESLQAAWKALAEPHGGSGWSSISIYLHGGVRLLAAKHFPGNDEALLVGLATEDGPGGGALPSGRGFEVSKVESKVVSGCKSLIAITRRNEGSLDLFSRMAEDLIEVLYASRGVPERQVLRSLLSRVEAWQDFMGDGGDTLLGREAELGLIGELAILSRLLEEGVSPVLSVEAWKGPIRGLQDFRFSSGSIEVKATTAATGYSARVGSLLQLDEAGVENLALAIVRLTPEPSGLTLPECINGISTTLSVHPGALLAFQTKLLKAGYFPPSAHLYVRRYKCSEIAGFRVEGDFPRLTPSIVPSGVRGAEYEIEVDVAKHQVVPFKDLLASIGAN